jgi:hypothetical protein
VGDAVHSTTHSKVDEQPFCHDSSATTAGRS